jgi:hypothetical protein
VSGRAAVVSAVPLFRLGRQRSRRRIQIGSEAERDDDLVRRCRQTRLFVHARLPHLTPAQIGRAEGETHSVCQVVPELQMVLMQ